jgi:hypothetical protein
MPRSRAGCSFIVCSALLLLLTHVAPTGALAQQLSAAARALESEQKMTDDERFSLLISVLGANTINPVRDKRIPEGVPMSAGYTSGVPHLGIPALLMTDASLGITNPAADPATPPRRCLRPWLWARTSIRSWRVRLC